MNRLIKTIIVIAALTVSGIAIAGPSYTFVDLGYLTGDAGDERTDGLGVRGSFGFAGMWHVAGELNALEANGGKDKNGQDISGVTIYGGLHPAMTDNTDLVIDLGFDVFEAETLAGTTGGDNTTDITAIFLRTGPRALLAGDKLELSAYVSVSIGESEPPGSQPKQDFTNVGLQVGGQYYFTPAISLGVEAEVNGSRSGPSGSSTSGGNDDLVRIFGRWSFGRR